MPVLSFYEGSLELSFLYKKDLNSSTSTVLDYSIFVFPYTYNEILFTNSFSREKFYTDAINVAAAELGADIKACEFHTIGLFSSPKITHNTTSSVSLLSKLSNNQIFLSNDLMAYKDGLHSYTPLSKMDITSNIQANVDIYSDLMYSATHDFSSTDQMLRTYIEESTFKPTGTTVLLCGDRFKYTKSDPASSYTLAIDAVKSPGVYYIKLDTEGIFPHSVVVNLEPEYLGLGTLVNSPGASEILFETDVGTKQIIDVENNRLFIVPIDVGNRGRLYVKGPEGQHDYDVTGGELGIIIDTRHKEQEIEYEEICLDTVRQALADL